MTESVLFRLSALDLTNCDGAIKTNKKIADRLNELSNYLSTLRVVNLDSRCSSGKKRRNIFRIAFNNGIISTVILKSDCSSNLEIERIYHDRYLMGKLLSDHVVDFVIRSNYIFISYTQSKLTLVLLDRGNLAPPGAEEPDENCDENDNDGTIFEDGEVGKRKLASRNPQICQVELDNYNTRRVERHLVLNDAGDLLLVWWKTGTNTVSPWSAPARSQRDLANVLVYSFSRTHFELISYGFVGGDIFEVCEVILVL